MRDLLRWLGGATETLAVVLVVVAAAGLVMFAWRLLRHSPRRAAGRTTRDLAVVAALAIIVVLTLLSPVDPGAETPRFRLVPFEDLRDALIGRHNLRLALVELVGNVFLFVPLGMALRWRFPALGVLEVSGIGLVVSVAVELLQALTGGGRWPETTDVITNTAGTFVGVVLAGAALARTRRS